jgi:hypothetical protein
VQGLIPATLEVPAFEAARERATECVIQLAKLRRQFGRGLQQDAEQWSVDVRSVAVAKGECKRHCVERVGEEAGNL